jgi:RNA polymerase primary sigma factor
VVLSLWLHHTPPYERFSVPVKKTAVPASTDAGTTTTKRRVAAKKPATKAASSAAAAKASTSDAQAAVDALDGADPALDVAVDVDPEDLKPEAAEVGTTTGFVYSDADDDDAPAQQVVSAGATADPVKDYLKQIGKVALLNASRRRRSPPTRTWIRN